MRSLDDLLQPFTAAEKPPAQFRIGTEAEKFGLLGDTRAPLPWDGPRSVRGVLARLAERFDWQPLRELPEGEVIALERDSASITLEPAGQLELSGAPLETIHETCAEFDGHLRELHAISEELDIVWLSLGFHPFARHADLPHVPKQRYGIMEKYLPTRGPRALDMMRRTCTVQANLDYSSEADAMRKLRLSLAVQPVVTALFANSPLYEGRPGEHLTERGSVWLGMDPDRSGILPFAWERSASYRSYIEWALDAPMFLIKRGTRYVPNTHQTFRKFMAEGSAGERATLSDWATHINTLFPEVRLKRTIEMRGADAQSSRLTCALPALWKGLLYDERSLDKLEQLIEPLDARLVQEARPSLMRSALAAQLAGRAVRSWAEDVVDIARGGLERIGAKNAAGQDERIHLAPLEALLQQGKTSAELILEAARGSKDVAAAVIDRTRV